MGAHDDLFAPELVARCIEALEAQPELILAHSYMGFVDEQGATLEDYDYRFATDSPRLGRFREPDVHRGGMTSMG